MSLLLSTLVIQSCYRQDRVDRRINATESTTVFTVPTILLPPTALAAAACLILVLGRIFRQKRIWGPACLIAIFVSGAFLASSGRLDLTRGAADQLPITLDQMAISLQWMCLALGVLFALTLFGANHRSDTLSQHFALLLLILAGMLLLAVANDLIVVYLAVELVGISVAALLFIGPTQAGNGHQLAVQNQPPPQAGNVGQVDSKTDGWIAVGGSATRFFLLNVLASAVVLYGFSLLYGLAGTTNLTGIRNVLVASYQPSEPSLPVGTGSRLGVVAMVLIFAGFGFKLSLVPFHFAALDVFENTSAWHGGLLAVLCKAVGFFALIRVLVGTMAGFAETGQLLALILAVTTMIFGSAMALLESRVRRLLAFVTISQTGFLLIGLAAAFWNSAHPQPAVQSGWGLPGGVQSAMFFLLTYSLAATGLVAVLVYLARRDRAVEFVEDLTGLKRTERVAAACAILFLLSLAGIPPLPGFWARLFVVLACLNVLSESSMSQVLVPHPGFVLLALLAVLNVVLTTTVALRLIKAIALDDPIARPQPTGGRGALAAAVIAALLTLGIAASPSSVIELWK